MAAILSRGEISKGLSSCMQDLLRRYDIFVGRFQSYPTNVYQKITESWSDNILFHFMYYKKVVMLCYWLSDLLAAKMHWYNSPFIR